MNRWNNVHHRGTETTEPHISYIIIESDALRQRRSPSVFSVPLW